MTRSAPQLRNFAKRIIDDEFIGRSPSERKAFVELDVCAKLQPQIQLLLGDVGARTLLGRALVRANEEVKWLRAVHINSAGTLSGWNDLRGKVGQEAFLDGTTELLAQLLGLLVTFIGAELTFNLVHEVWPDVMFDDLKL